MEKFARAPRGSLPFRRAVGLGGPLITAVAAGTLLAGRGGGLYWWPAAVLVSYTGALANVWVLLIEILR